MVGAAFAFALTILRITQVLEPIFFAFAGFLLRSIIIVVVVV